MVTRFRCSATQHVARPEGHALLARQAHGADGLVAFAHDVLAKPIARGLARNVGIDLVHARRAAKSAGTIRRTIAREYGIPRAAIRIRTAMVETGHRLVVTADLFGIALVVRAENHDIGRPAGARRRPRTRRTRPRTRRTR